MLKAHEYLELVSERGRTGATLERVYRNIRRKDLFIAAYMNLYANKGATTPGTNPEDTVDGMSMERIDHIISELQKGTYKWTPVKRVYIPKKNGKERPLGIPNMER